MLPTRPPRVGEGSAARDDEDQARQTSEPLRHAAICRRRTARGRGHFAFAAKRVVPAMLRATGLCLSAPIRIARQVVDRGFTPNYDCAVQTLSDAPYGKWRDYDPEDAIRFYALRLHEAGMIKSSPNRIIAAGTDWRSLREVKKELG